jgi:Glucodextranase, domain B
MNSPIGIFFKVESSCNSHPMNRYLIIFTLILSLTACSPTPTVVPSAPTTNSNSPNTVAVTSLPQEVIPTTDIQPTATLISTPESSGTLSLQILSPQDEAVVTTSQVDVIGSAPAGAVVSINDEILLVGADGQFKTTISLDEGPNLIEIIASDDNGNETSLLLTVTYEP